MQEVAVETVSISQALELFGPSLPKHQAESQGSLLSVVLDEMGFQILWYVAPKGYYLFLVPRYRSTYKWRELSAWYPRFFDQETAAKLKVYARSNKWALQKLPILAGLNVEAISGIGSKYEGWNDLVAVREYVLPLKNGWVDRLRDYLCDWEIAFSPYVFRPLQTGISPTVAAARSELTDVLLATPFTTDPTRLVPTAKNCVAFLREVLARWSETEVMQELHTQDVAPALLRLDLVPSFQMNDRVKALWETVYELRVEFLEKFQFPWFYEDLLDALGAQGERRGQSAGDIVERGAAPLTKSVIPPELHRRVAHVAFALERRWPILLRRPWDGLAV